jgi:hypothetical protein
LPQCFQAFIIACLWIYEKQVLSDRACEKLSFLRNHSHPIAKIIEIHIKAVNSIEKNATGYRAIETGKQFDQCRLARAGGSDKRNGFS